MAQGNVFRNPIVWVLLAALVGVGAFRSMQRAEATRPTATGAPEVGKQVPAFQLVNSQGEAYGSEDLRGTVWVASFFFTRCMAICPMLIESLSGLQHAYDADGIEGVRLVSFSVDPEHDTAERLRDYAEEHGIDPRRWSLLTGEKAAMKSLLVDGFEVPMGDPEVVGETLIDVAHSGKIALVDAHGVIRGFYDYDQQGLGAIFEASKKVLQERR